MRPVASEPARQGTSRTDVALAVVLLAVGVADVLTTRYTGSTVVALTAVTLQTAPLAWRRSRPVWMVVAAAAGVAVETAGGAAYGDIAGNIAVLVVVFSAARWIGSRGSRSLAAVVLVGAFVAHVASQGWAVPSTVLVNLVLLAPLLGGLWWLGSALRRAAVREAEQDSEVARVVEAERRAIARDLHDVVGHALAGISLTAGAAQRQVGGHDPELAESLALIGSLSRDAASDVRTLVGLLRQAGDELPDGPQPGLATVPALLDRARAAGLDVSLTTSGQERPAPAGWQLAAYRVVQEGLTNVLRHAPGARAEVALDWGVDALVVSVVDSGARLRKGMASAGSVVDLGAGGHGLVGLRERVGVHGGTVEAAGTADGFRLTARLPLP